MTLDINGSYDVASSVAIQTDGEIVVVGETFNPTYNPNEINYGYGMAVACFNSGGILDTSFQVGSGTFNGGYAFNSPQAGIDVITDGGSGSDAFVAIQTDGRSCWLAR